MKQGWSLLSLDDGSENFAPSTKLKVLVCLPTCLALFQKAVTCTILAHQRIQQHYTAGLIFKYSFFPSTISEWNKLDLKIRQSKALLTFRNALIKIGRPISKPIYNIHNPVSLKSLTRVRLSLSHLNQHKFYHNFQNCLNPL